jgi:hypothetical protein
VEDFYRRAVDVQLIDSGDFVLQSVESAFEISLELLLLLIADPLKKACLFDFLTFAKRKLLVEDLPCNLSDVSLCRGHV